MKPANQKITKIAFLFLAFSTIYNLSSTTSFAQVASSGLSVIPPRKEIKIKPDGVVSFTDFKVRNESKETKTITVGTRDFIVTDNIGTPNFLNESSDQLNNRWAASSWVQVSPSTFTLKPGEIRGLTVSVLAPANALPGGHYTSIFYTPDSSVTMYNSTGASIQTNVGTLLYITVEGDVNQNATIQSFSAPKFSEFGPIDFKATIKNLSDIHIQPVGSIIIKNWFGGKTAQIKLDPTNIFPYTTRDFQSTLDKKWLFGRYSANLNAIYGTAGGVIATTIFFWVIPWRLIILIAAAIAIIATLIIITKKKPKDSGNDVAQLEKELETLKKKYKDN